MKLSAGGLDFIVHMEYHFGQFETETKPTGVTVRIHEGTCQREPDVNMGACTRPTTSGSAFCHPKDQFVRATGRKMAIGRALRWLFPDNKAIRTALWADYRTKAS